MQAEGSGGFGGKTKRGEVVDPLADDLGLQLSETVDLQHQLGDVPPGKSRIELGLGDEEGALGESGEDVKGVHCRTQGLLGGRRDALPGESGPDDSTITEVDQTGAVAVDAECRGLGRYPHDLEQVGNRPVAQIPR